MECSAVWVGLNSWQKKNVHILLDYFFNNIMHFPYNLLCKQIVFLPAMKRRAVLLVLQPYLGPAAQGTGGLGADSLQVHPLLTPLQHASKPSTGMKRVYGGRSGRGGGPGAEPQGYA